MAGTRRGAARSTAGWSTRSGEWSSTSRPRSRPSRKPCSSAPASSSTVRPRWAPRCCSAIRAAALAQPGPRRLDDSEGRDPCGRGAAGGGAARVLRGDRARRLRRVPPAAPRPAEERQAGAGLGGGGRSRLGGLLARPVRHAVATPFGADRELPRARPDRLLRRPGGARTDPARAAAAHPRSDGPTCAGGPFKPAKRRCGATRRSVDARQALIRRGETHSEHA